MIDGDPDLKYLKEINERYHAKEFLILTYTPKEAMTSESSINNLLSLKYKIQSLEWVHSVITLLDIPLLNSTDKTLTERLQKTLKISAKKFPVVQLKVGTVDMSDEDLAKNIIYLHDQIEHHLPKEKHNLRGSLLKLTMGKPIKI